MVHAVSFSKGQSTHNSTASDSHNKGKSISSKDSEVITKLAKNLDKLLKENNKDTGNGNRQAKKAAERASNNSGQKGATVKKDGDNDKNIVGMNSQSVRNSSASMKKNIANAADNTDANDTADSSNTKSSNTKSGNTQNISMAAPKANASDVNMNKANAGNSLPNTASAGFTPGSVEESLAVAPLVAALPAVKSQSGEKAKKSKEQNKSALIESESEAGDDISTVSGNATTSVSTHDYRTQEQEIQRRLDSGDVMGALTMLFGLLQVEEQDKLARTAQELVKLSQKNIDTTELLTFCQALDTALKSVSSSDKPNPTIADTATKGSKGYKDDQEALDKLNKLKHYLGGDAKETDYTMEEFNKLSATDVQQLVGSAQKAENEATSMKTTTINEVQSLQMTVQTFMQTQSSMISSVKSLLQSVVSAIGR